MAGYGTGFHTASTDVFTWVLQNPDTGSTFTVLQQADTPSMANVSTAVTLETSAGTLAVHDVALYGRQSKILVTDYPLGTSNHTLLYCSADIATSEAFTGDTTVLVLYLKEGQAGEFAFMDAADTTNFTVFGPSQITATTRRLSSAKSQAAFTYVQGPGATAVLFANGVLVYLLDQLAAWRLWAPDSGPSLSAPGLPGRLILLGPYLVRSASVDWATGELAIQGDSDTATTLDALVGSRGNSTIHTVIWNGRRLPATRTAYGSYTVAIPGDKDRVADVATLLPTLAGDGSVLRWLAADALPEARPDYDDRRWTVCNKTTSRSPVPPVTLPVLFASDYGFYAGAKVYRGRFSPGSSSPISVNITASGGLGFGWTAWLNGQLLGGHTGDARQATTSAVLAIPADHLTSTENVLTVLVDYHGHDETSVRNGLGNPRGLLGVRLLYSSGSAGSTGTGISSWRMAGNAGGPANIDPVRGTMNEGGLYAERLGWHLPGFDAAADPAFSAFPETASPLDGLSSAGVRFYITTFTLGHGHGLPADLDVPLGIELAAPPGTVARVQLWVNGYQFGKYVPHVGPQTRFPVPWGILNTGGQNNTLALSLWAMTAAGARLSRVALVGYESADGTLAAYETGFFGSGDRAQASVDELQPRWTNRSKYA